MGKMKENPRYNIVSTRISDADLEAIEQSGLSRSVFIQEAITEKLQRDFRERVDQRLREVA